MNFPSDNPPPNISSGSTPRFPTLLRLEPAAVLIGVSRTSFWRFRRKHKIRLVVGRRVSVEDIRRALEQEQSAEVGS